ncbi:MAG: hypothetical protein NTV49_14520 [Kiritimatiellaeota bacterium]|nr:hypothetical protein [Kiritimatiellota bacterium]
MGAWAELTVDVVRNALPSDMSSQYQPWVDANPAKANRLSEIVAEILRTFRQAVAAFPGNVLDENPDTVPATGFRHALDLVIYNLGMEMGVRFAPEVYTLIARAEIWLRMVQNGGIRVDPTACAGTPSYCAPDDAAAHAFIFG